MAKQELDSRVKWTELALLALSVQFLVQDLKSAKTQLELLLHVENSKPGLWAMTWGYEPLMMAIIEIENRGISLRVAVFVQQESIHCYFCFTVCEKQDDEGKTRQ